MAEPVSSEKQADSPKREPTSVNDRLLVEAAAALERIEGRASDDEHLNSAVIAADGDIEHRLVNRAKGIDLRRSGELADGLREVRHSIAIAILVGVVLALIGGIGTAKAALISINDKPVNFFWALTALLGLQTLMLIVWLGMMIASRRQHKRGGIIFATLGGLLFRFARFLFARTHRLATQAAASSAIATVLFHPPIARWTLSSISHGLWLVYSVGCLATLILLLSTHQYSFAWETTILSERAFEPMTRAISAVPAALGFEVPSPRQIDESRWTSHTEFGQSSAARQAWSSLLVGAVVAYGFAPRLLLLALALGQRRLALARYRIDVGRPEFARLLQTLMPAERLGIVDHDEGGHAGIVDHSAVVPRARPSGPPAIVGVELAERKSATSWPPPLHAVRWNDLGFVETRDDQRRVLAQLSDSPEQPATLVIVCALTTTPDRGIASFLEKMAHAVSSAVALVLTGGQAMRDRGDAQRLLQRVEDWRQLGMSAGIPHERIVELDLDYFTQASAAKLASIIESPARAKTDSAARRLEQAFSLIARECGDVGVRSTSDYVELHRKIMLIYQDQISMWQRVASLATARVQTNDLAATLKANAGKMVDRLPARLRLNPRWLAAGAAAGALGCVAASALIAPVAIAALPMWSAIGAGISAAIAPFRNQGPPAIEPDSVGDDLEQSIRSATLLAIVLELQGGPEPVITRVLDQALVDDELPSIDEASIRRWLDHVRHRFDMALARETAR